MTNTIKKTKKEMYEELSTLIDTIMLEPEVKEDYKNFLAHEIELIDKRKNKEVDKPDPLKEEVYNLLTDEPKTLKEILTALSSNEEATKGKVINRLSKLVKENKATKGVCLIENKKNITYMVV